MSKPVTLYANASDGRKKVWSIFIEDDNVTVTVEWGYVGKSMQRSSDPSKATKTISAEQVALNNTERQIRKKREEGYLADGEKRAERDIFKKLDKNFVPAKPQSVKDDDSGDFTLSEIRALEKHGKLWIQRKRDGQRHLVLFTRSGDVRIYSRRMEDMTDNFPLLRNELKNYGFPPCTILDGEIIIQRDGDDCFKEVSSITKADPRKGATYEKSVFDEHLRFMVFDMLYHDELATWKLPYRERYNALREYLTNEESEPVVVYLAPLLNISAKGAAAPNCFDTLRKECKTWGWEGIVLWQNDMATVVRDGGKPKRVNCIKWKPVNEQDFIATGYELGSGSQADLVGAIFLAEYSPEGKLRACGKCGTGFDMETRKRALKWNYPNVVVKIKFDSQEPTGKLRFPVFLGLHEDKTPEECIGKELEEE